MQRPIAYRLAARTFRYPVYLALEVTWIVAAVLAVAAEFVGSLTSWPLVLLLVALAVIHSGRMTMVQPWLLLKSVVLGVVIFGVAIGLHSLFAAPTNPLLLATLLASGHYLWQGEQWTRDRAQRAMSETP